MIKVIKLILRIKHFFQKCLKNIHVAETVKWLLSHNKKHFNFTYSFIQENNCTSIILRENIINFRLTDLKQNRMSP